MLGWRKKHPWLVRLLVTISLVLVLFGTSLFIPFGSNLCEYSVETKHTECAYHHLGPFAFLWLIEIIDKHNGFVTAIATICIGAFTRTLWRSADKQATLTRESIDEAIKSSENQLRAYFSFRSIDTNRYWGPDGNLINAGFLAKWINTGQTPAKEIALNACVITRQPDQSIEFDLPFTLKQRMSIGPTIAITSGEVRVPPDALPAVVKRTSRIYVYFSASWDDIFGKRQFEEAVAEMVPVENPFDQNSKTPFIPEMKIEHYVVRWLSSD